MSARTKQPKPPPPPKPWRREDGRYRSADDRFTIEGGGAGRWFLTDEASLDELGLARTLGPYDTLDEAKDAAAGRRDAGSESSPLADRLAAAAQRPRSAPRATGTSRGRGPAAAVDAGLDELAGVSEGARVPEPAPEPVPLPPARTWLDELADDDAPAASRARRLIATLGGLGVDDAEAVVRRDVLGRQPAVATRVLGGAIARAMRVALEPAALASEARRAIPGPAMRQLAGVDDAALAAYAAFIAGRVLEATLGVVASQDRAPEGGVDLPGWRLVERPPSREAGESAPRRLIVTLADVVDGGAGSESG